MQNRYTADIGDYSKLGLLRALKASGLSIGVNWYLTPDEEHNGDGCHVEYLSDECANACDEELWLALKNIVKTEQRKVSSLENETILRAVFVSDMLDFKGKVKQEREKLRANWHARALAKLVGNDIVFVDPDNGLIVPSAAGKPKENKYVLAEELANYYAQGSSVIYYQHKARRKDDFYREQHEELIHRAEFPGAAGLGLKFLKMSQRYYFFILQPWHREVVEDTINEMVQGAWKGYFEIL